MSIKEIWCFFLIDKKKESNIRTIAITGSTGFIGSSLIKTIRLSDKLKIIPITRIHEKGTWRFDFSNLESDSTLIYCSEESNIAKTEEEGSEGLKLSLTNLEDILSKDYKRIIYLSSGVIYLNRFKDSSFYTETSDVYRNTWYKKRRVKSEELVKNTGCGVILRLSNVYGLGNIGKNIFGDLMCQLKTKDPLEIKVRDSTPIRDYIHISDVVNVIFRIAKEDVKGTYNLSTGVGTSVLDLVYLFGEVLNRNISKVISTNKNKDNSVLVLDNKKIVNDLHWLPKINLKMGIEKILNQEEV